MAEPSETGFNLSRRNFLKTGVIGAVVAAGLVKTNFTFSAIETGLNVVTKFRERGAQHELKEKIDGISEALRRAAEFNQSMQGYPPFEEYFPHPAFKESGVIDRKRFLPTLVDEDVLKLTAARTKELLESKGLLETLLKPSAVWEVIQQLHNKAIEEVVPAGRATACRTEEQEDLFSLEKMLGFWLERPVPVKTGSFKSAPKVSSEAQERIRKVINQITEKVPASSIVNVELEKNEGMTGSFDRCRNTAVLPDSDWKPQGGALLFAQFLIFSHEKVGHGLDVWVNPRSVMSQVRIKNLKDLLELRWQVSCKAAKHFLERPEFKKDYAWWYQLVVNNEQIEIPLKNFNDEALDYMKSQFRKISSGAHQNLVSNYFLRKYFSSEPGPFVEAVKKRFGKDEIAQLGKDLSPLEISADSWSSAVCFYGLKLLAEGNYTGPLPKEFLTDLAMVLHDYETENLADTVSSYLAINEDNPQITKPKNSHELIQKMESWPEIKYLKAVIAASDKKQLSKSIKGISLNI